MPVDPILKKLAELPEPDLDDPDNPEWTEEDFARARGPESLSPAELAAFPRTRVRGVQKAPVKTPVSLRLSREVIEHFRESGPGWQSRIDEALKQAIARKIA